MQGRSRAFRRGGLFVTAALLLLLLGCQDSTSPTPAPTPSPGAEPNSTALANVALVSARESSQRPDTFLTQIFGGVRTDGRLPDGTIWTYSFQRPPNTAHYFTWAVHPDGRVEYTGEASVFARPLVDIRPDLLVDTPTAVRVALANGGSDFTDRYPDASIRVLGQLESGVATWRFTFSAQGTFCQPLVYVNARTGAFMGRGVQGC